MRPHHGSSVLYRTIRWLEGTSLFLLSAALLLGGVFVLGNYQSFLDSTQLLVLQLLSATGVLCLSSGVCYLLALVVWMIRRRRAMVFRLLYAVVATAVGTAATLVSGVLETLVRPL